MKKDERPPAGGPRSGGAPRGGADDPVPDGTRAAPRRDDRSRDAGGRGQLWPWLLLGLLFLAVGGGLYWYLASGAAADDEAGSGEGPRAPLIETAEVNATDRIEITQTGFVRPLFEIELASEVSGRIASIAPEFRRGSRVAEGEPLVALDSATFDADVAGAEAGLQEARAALTEARVARDRAETLEEGDIATEESLQQAILGVAQAEAALAAARAEVTRAEQAREDATIRAPLDALVIARDASPGGFVQPGAPLGRLVGLEAAEVEMGLTPSDLALLGDPGALAGAAVEIRAVGPGREPLAEGVVTDVDPSIAPETRTTGLIVRIEGAFDERSPRPLRVDELVELALPARLPDAGVLSVPAAALKDRDTLWALRDGVLERLSVDVIRRGEDSVDLVSDALSAGDRVMLSDMAAAFDGQEVRVAGDDDGDGSG